MTILNKILLEKHKEVAILKSERFEYQTTSRKVKTFRELVLASNRMNIIAEIKRASPSKGPIQLGVDPAKQAKAYESLGATAVSVLTDTPFFGGSMDDLRAVREAISLPILCKDFIIDNIQIDRAKAAGANIILLIVAALDDTDLKNLYAYAKHLNLEVLVEVHTKDEMKRALHLGADIIGINNRDLTTFKVDLTTTKELATMVTDPAIIVVSESGIQTKTDVTDVKSSGVNAILVGETLMRTDNLQTTFNELQITLQEKEG